MTTYAFNTGTDPTPRVRSGSGLATPPSRKILILGNFRQSVTVIRSLARAGFAPIVGRQGPPAFTEYSRYTAAVWVHPPLEQADAFLAALRRFLTIQDVSFIFPVGETAQACLARHRQQIPPFTQVIMPPPTTVLTCLDKAEIYQIVSALSIPLPESQVVYDLSQLTSAAERVGYPCIVKPNTSLVFFFGRKAIICRSTQDVHAGFPFWPLGNECLIVQKYISGYRPNCHFAALQGKVFAYFEHDVLRTDRIDETGYEVEGISVQPTPILRHYCERLVQALHYSGVGCVQFLIDRESGAVYFLEINPRLDATCALPYRCAYDFPKLALECVAYLDKVWAFPLPVPSAYPAGKRVHWLLGDVQGLCHGLEAGEVDLRTALRWCGRILRSFAKADMHLTYWWKDPLPTGFLYAGLLLSLWAHVRKAILSWIYS